MNAIGTTNSNISSIAFYGKIKAGTSGVGSGWLLAGDYYPVDITDPNKAAIYMGFITNANVRYNTIRNKEERVFIQSLI